MSKHKHLHDLHWDESAAIVGVLVVRCPRMSVYVEYVPGWTGLVVLQDGVFSAPFLRLGKENEGIWYTYKRDAPQLHV